MACSLVTSVASAGQGGQQAQPPAGQSNAKPEARDSATKQSARAAANVKLPDSISAAFREAYPSAIIRATACGTDDGRTVYHIESVDHGLARRLVYDPDGTVVAVGVQVPIANLPRAVSRALTALYPKATITLAQRITRGPLVHYELSLKGAADPSLTFTPDGTLVLFDAQK
jgi:hypothetical protein